MMSHKFLVQVAIVVMISAFGIGAAFAQDNGDDPSPMPPIDGSCLQQIERPDVDRDARLAELGLSAEEIQAAREDGTLRELVAENRDAFQDLREAAREEFEAEMRNTMIDCVNDELADGRLTQEQADALITAIENGTLRDDLRSGALDDLFPNLPELRERLENRERPQRPFGERGERGERGFGGRFGGDR